MEGWEPTPPSQAAVEWMRRREVELILDSLSPRDRLVLQQRFGLADQERILEDVGRRPAVSRERIREIEAMVLKLREEDDRHYREIVRITRQLLHELGRPPTDAEISEQLGISKGRAREIVRKAHGRD